MEHLHYPRHSNQSNKGDTQNCLQAAVILVDEDKNKLTAKQVCRILGDKGHGKKEKEERSTGSIRRGLLEYSGQSHYRNQVHTESQSSFLFC